MRHGIPVAGNFLQQELAIVDGAPSMPWWSMSSARCSPWPRWPSVYHTKLFTPPPGQDRRATHIEFGWKMMLLNVARKILMDGHPEL